MLTGNQKVLDFTRKFKNLDSLQNPLEVHPPPQKKELPGQILSSIQTSKLRKICWKTDLKNVVFSRAAHGIQLNGAPLLRIYRLNLGITTISLFERESHWNSCLSLRNATSLLILIYALTSHSWIWQGSSNRAISCFPGVLKRERVTDWTVTL